MGLGAAPVTPGVASAYAAVLFLGILRRFSRLFIYKAIYYSAVIVRRGGAFLGASVNGANCLIGCCCLREVRQERFRVVASLPPPCPHATRAADLIAQTFVIPPLQQRVWGRSEQLRAPRPHGQGRAPGVGWAGLAGNIWGQLGTAGLIWGQVAWGLEGRRARRGGSVAWCRGASAAAGGGCAHPADLGAGAGLGVGATSCTYGGGAGTGLGSFPACFRQEKPQGVTSRG